jgi:hypothetical protein
LLWCRDHAKVFAILLEELFGDRELEERFTDGEEIAHDEAVAGQREGSAYGVCRVSSVDDDAGAHEVALREQRDRGVERIER